MKTLLVVDDDKLSLASARAVLCDKYKVIPVTRGDQAIKYFENGGLCDLILLDINMPEMDGFQVMEKLHANENLADIPIIFLTADNDAETETRCLKSGAIDFVGKPFVPSVMISRVGRALELEDLRKELANRLEEKTQEVSDMKSKSCKDTLTGLWNRAYTEEAVNRMLSDGICGALMMIDMDNFKAINDNYGHIMGDQTLKMFAETLEKFSNEGDVLCRIGGDEFIAFFKALNAKSEIAERAGSIISDMCYKIQQHKFETDTSVSIGIARVPGDGNDFKKLYSCADKALYHVKQNGKNSYHFYSDQSETENIRAGKTVDLQYLREIINRTDEGRGAYTLDFDSFHHVYNFINRFVERSDREVQTLLFTIMPDEGVTPETNEVEDALETLEQTICTSLRREDVFTRYSSRQVVVILIGADSENGDMVAKRIISSFENLYKGSRIRLDYGIARMEGKGSGKKRTDEVAV